MSHPTQLELSMYADEALGDPAAGAVSAHLADCHECRAVVAALQAEAGAITMALQAGEDAPAAMPQFSRPISLRSFAIANIGTGLVLWLAQFLWKTIFGELVINASSRITSFYLPDAYAVSSQFLLHLIERGTAMFDAYIGFIVVCFTAALTLWLLMSSRRFSVTHNVCLLVTATCVFTMTTPSAMALDVRKSDNVLTIGADEVIEDTLMLASETILVEGTVNGDLIAVGQRVDITGQVSGNIITFAETVTLKGDAGGMVLGAASTFTVEGSASGNLWAAGEKVNIGANSQIGGNLTTAAQRVLMQGSVGRDLHAASETVEIEGQVDQNLVVAGRQLRLLGDAQVGGNVRFHTSDPDGLHRAESASVMGEVTFEEAPEGASGGSRYRSIEFYLWKLAYLFGAFVTGLLLLWLLPSMRNIALGSGMQTFKTACFGLLGMISVPVAALVLGLTIIGLPLAMIAIALWLIALYLAKVLVGAIVGRMLFQADSNSWQSLLAGLAIVVVAINIPYIGGVIGALVTLVGLGLIVEYLLRLFNVRGAAA